MAYALGDTTEAILTARHAVVLATGTRPNVPEVPGLAQARPWTNRDLTTMTHVPPRALIVGGGPVAVEFATILTGLGSAVTLLVRENTLLRNCEPEARELVALSLQSKGVKIHFATELSAVARPVAGGPVTATFRGQTIKVDEVVLAAGRRTNTENLGLETLGLPDGGIVSVNDHLQAVDVTGGWLYALGDTTGRARLSHISTYHGRVVADIIAARAAGRELSENELIARDAGNLAQVIHTEPQVAWVGRTESQAASRRVRGTDANCPLPRRGGIPRPLPGWLPRVGEIGDQRRDQHTARSDIRRAAVLRTGSSSHPGYRREDPSHSATPRCRATSDGQSGLGSPTRRRVRTCLITE